ncbi:ABC transporter substrate-binding protein [Thalassolituus oleivorans]|uniref:ABC transporter substrate-binding protein n=2 Tax=Thalassolituus oleivorans TaxID=187493 RepID=UPI000AC1A325|nr:ABC transporter substrate-binding protein [Thalassolituus oleivorans]
MLQQFRMLFQCLCLGCVLLASFANAEPDFISPTPLVDRIDTPVMPVKTTGPIKVPMITWGGDMITLLANGLSTRTQAKSIFAKQGLDVELVLQDNFDRQIEDYLAGESPYLRCTVGMCNQAIDLLNKDERTKPIVIYQLTWSRGGDTLVSKNGVMTVGQLKGKTIAIQAYGPHVDFMTTLLGQAGLSMKDVNVRWLPDLTASENSPVAALSLPDVDASFMIISDAYGITSGRRVGTGDRGSVEGARMIISTMFARRVIADVYVVRSDYYASHKADVERFVNAMASANDELQVLMKDLQNPRKLSLLEVAADVLLGDKAATPDIENLYYDAQFTGRDDNHRFLQDDLYPHRLSVLNERDQDAFLELGLIHARGEMKAASWD